MTIEVDPRDELLSLAADLRGWMQHQRLLHVGAPNAELPSGAVSDALGPSAAAAVPAGPAVVPPEPAAPSAPPEIALPSPPPPPVEPPVAPAARSESIAPRPVVDAPSTLEALAADLAGCTRCRLSQERSRIVFGVGSPTADLVFVGEGPGHHEDQQGEPFVGPAGELLTTIIENVLGLKRAEVYIANVVKCRPPGNRDPQPDEVATCSPYLMRQLDLIRPAVVVGLGNFAIRTLLDTQASVGQLRGRAHPFRDAVLIPTYHPAYLLRAPQDKRKTLEDMKLVRRELEARTGRTLPPIARRR